MADRRPGRVRVGWRSATGPGAADALLTDLVVRHRGGIAPRIGRRCDRCGSVGHGVPVVEDDALHLSLSRAPGLVVAAVSTAGPIGVDVEQAGSARFPGFEDVAVHPDEVSGDPTLIWVRKEAALKATGWGLEVDPAQVRIDDARRVVAWDPRLPAPDRCWLDDLPLERSYVGAVAVIREQAAPAG